MLSCVAFADNENYDGIDVSDLDFSGSSRKYSSWVNCIAENTIFAKAVAMTNYAGANFSHANLTNASFLGGYLAGVDFTGANLTKTNLQQAQLSCNFTNANLTNASFASAIIRSGNFTDSTITGTDFSSTTSNGFTQKQLYQTASYRNKNLSFKMRSFFRFAPLISVLPPLSLWRDSLSWYQKK